MSYEKTGGREDGKEVDGGYERVAVRHSSS